MATINNDDHCIIVEEEEGGGKGDDMYNDSCIQKNVGEHDQVGKMIIGSGGNNKNNDNQEQPQPPQQQPQQHCHATAAAAATEELTTQETNKAVFRLRLLLLLVLGVSAVTVSVIVYWYMDQQEHHSFEAKLHSDAHKIFESIGTTLDQTLGSTDAFVIQLVQYADYSNNNSTWPFVTVPGFALQAAKLLRLSKAFQCRMVVFVAPEEKQRWNQYVLDNSHDWIQNTLQIQATDLDGRKNLTPIDYQYMISPYIFGFGFAEITEPTSYQNNYGPTWQQYPIVPPSYPEAPLPISWDSWQVPFEATAIQQAVTQQRIVISPATNIASPTHDDNQTQLIAQNVQGWAKNYLQPPNAHPDPSEPFTTVITPIYERAINSVVQQQQNFNGTEEAVGVFSYSIFWRDLLAGILPSDSKSIIVVVTDPCGTSFTYQLDGGDGGGGESATTRTTTRETYLGPGDLHDNKYNHLRQSKTLNEIMKTTNSNDGSSSTYTGIPLSETYCIKTIHVYPSQEMQDVYETNDPKVFAIAALLIFVVTSAVFLLYDKYVARRQYIIQNRALASEAVLGAALSSLTNPSRRRNSSILASTNEQQSHAF